MAYNIHIDIIAFTFIHLSLIAYLWIHFHRMMAVLKMPLCDCVLSPKILVAKRLSSDNVTLQPAIGGVAI